ncbi:MAG TPA: hypothetical protein VGH88_15705, partial [Streptosporangiaceae bacterium]
MSTDPIGPGPAGDPPDDDLPGTTGDDVLEGEVINFPRPAAPRRPAAGQPGEPRPIIPEHLRTWTGIRKALRWRYRRARHHTLYHLARSPRRLLLAVLWSPVGLARIGQAQLSWWWLSEQTYLRQEAIAANDPRTWHQLHQHAREVR